MKKWMALCLICALLAGLLSGCAATSAQPEDTAEPTPAASEQLGDGADGTETPDPGAGEEEIDYEAMYQAGVDTLTDAWRTYAADTVMFTVDGEPVTWGLFYYLMAGELESVLYYTGMLPENYDEAMPDESTMGQYLIEIVTKNCKYYALLYQKAKEMGITLSQEDEDEIQSYWEALLEDYGSEEALVEAMASSWLDKDVYMFLLRGGKEGFAIMDELYGTEGEKLTDEEVNEWAAEAGYVRVKHILYKTIDDSYQSLDEETVEERKTRAETVLAELLALTEDNEALEARFDEIMNAESEDGRDGDGNLGAPDGYTFTEGSMVAEFEDAAFALEEYGLSELVETMYGYHIILRLPLDADASMRQSAANDLFGQDLKDWVDSAVVEWEPAFENMDLNALFGNVPSEK